ncbi:MAG: secreted protein [Marmoricola sp.]|nr:secreted protein [Marmoricola sp.]
MTTTLDQTPAAPTASVLAPVGWFRRHRAVLLIGTALVAATAAALVGRGAPEYSGALDPSNSHAGGARAVARVLGHQGIEVDVVRSAAALGRARIDRDTTVVVTSTWALGTRTADRVASTDAGEVVLVDPEIGVPTLFGQDEGARARVASPVSARCSDPRFDGLTLRVDQATSYSTGSSGCFPVGGRATVQPVGNGFVLLGAGDILANDQILRSDNAAVALRLLGQHDRLVWYVPDPDDNTVGDGLGIGPLLPRWLHPGLWLAGVAVLALVLWRGRRLGPLVREPLPVVVTAIEATRSRGRLYRKANDRAHAAESLRRAARSRIAHQLRLGRRADADPETLARDVADAGGLDLDRVHRLLVGQGPGPQTDKELTHLANDLAELIREVRRS